MERLFLECAVRAGLLVAGTAIVLYAMRVKDVAAKYRVWAGVMLLMLVLPVWTAWGPKAPVRVLPPMAERIANQEIAPTSAFPAAVLPPDTGNLEISEPAARPSGWGRQEILLGVYLLGLCVLLLRLAIGTVRAHRLVRRAVLRDGRLTSSSCAVPVTVGWLHPTVILPEDWHEWSQAKLDAVLTHEGEHARRRDPLVQWVALLNRALFWFHPAAWWLESRLAGLAEEACDNVVLARGHDPGDYSEYLMDMARAVTRSGNRVNVAGLAMPGSSLPRRIKRIIEGVHAVPVSRMRMAGVIVACTITCTLFAAGRIDHAVVGGAPALVTPEQTGGMVLPDMGRPAFDWVSIKPRTSGPDNWNRSNFNQGLLSATFTLRNLLAMAYPVQSAQGRAILGRPGSHMNQGLWNAAIGGAPDWMDSLRFDIEARTERKPTPGQWDLMMQALLADRFKLAVHYETEIVPVYGLELWEPGRLGPQLRQHVSDGSCWDPTAAQPPPSLTGQPTLPYCGGFRIPVPDYMILENPRNLTTENLADYFTELVDRPVLNRTGLSGTFDFDLFIDRTPPRDYSKVFGELRRQLGLRLVPQNGPIEVFVIDHVERPSENEPAQAQTASASSAVPPQARPVAVQPSSLPPPEVRPSFASGSIKIVNPEPNGRVNIGWLGPGPFTASSVSLRGLLAGAYQLTPAQSRIISGAPDWIDSVRFDIEAHAEGDPGIEQKRLMEQSLLADRFKLAVHHETQVVPVYTLELAETGKTGPHLLPHSPEAKCIVRSPTTKTPLIAAPGEAVPAFCGGTLSMISEKVAEKSGNNVTMEQLAALLSGDVDRPIINSTGLTGEFDYELSVDFSARQPLAPFGHAYPSPNHALALKDLSLLFEIVREQLGLKLVPQNGPVDVLVIDHVEAPAEGSFAGQQPAVN